MKQSKRILATVTALIMMFSCLPTAGALPVSAEGTSSFAQNFADPDTKHSMKIRTWWPSADLSDEQIADEVRQIAEAGFGGMEIICIPQGYDTTQIDTEKYGWGTEGWNRAMVKVMEEAEKYNLQVDMTIGPRWPAGVPGLDVNGDYSSKKIVTATSHLEIESTGSAVYPLPQQPVSDYDQQFVGLVVARTDGVLSDNGKVSEYALRSDTLTVLDESCIDWEGGTFTWAPEEQGEWTVFAFWSTATGQTSGTTSPTAYVIDHFSFDATNQLLNYWDDTLLEEIVNHWAKYGGNMFEDSLELTSTDIPWSPVLEEYFQENYGYDILPYLPLLVSQCKTGNLSETYTAVDNDTINREVYNDFFYNLSDMYVENHIDVITEWCSKYGIQYRAQAQGTGDIEWVEPLDAQGHVDIVEGESLGMGASPDAFRSLAGAANMSGTEIVSCEFGAEYGSLYQITWQWLTELANKCAMAGANQFYLHGFASQAQQTGSNKWPGWMPFDSPKFSETWNQSQPSWDYMDEAFVNYISRLQTFLQYGKGDADFAVYRYVRGLRTDGEGHPDGVLYMNEDKTFPGENPVTNIGYSYNYISPSNFDLEGAVVRDGVLNPDGVGYRALVINDESTMELDAARQILSYAKQGLPIILIGGTPVADGTFRADDDAKLVALFEELKQLDNVYQISDENELPWALQQADVTPSVSYDNAYLVSQHRHDANADLYYLYNTTSSRDYYNTFSGPTGGDYHDDNATIATTVTLEGRGKPYSFDPWTGEITPILEYIDNGDGTLSIDVEIMDCEAKLIGITPEDSYFGSYNTVPVQQTSGAGEVIYAGDGMMYRTTQQGAYSVNVNGSEVSGTVGSVASPVRLDNNWMLNVTSWQPGDLAQDTADPSYDAADTAKVPLPEIELETLTAWSNLEALQGISGQGLYTTTFVLDGDFTGAYLDLGETYDNILEVTVNGIKMDPVDQFNHILDLGNAAVEGENTLTIRTGTTLCAAVRTSGGNTKATDYHPVYPTTYGLLGGISVVPYADIDLSISQPDKSILNKVIDYAQQQYDDPSFGDVIADVQLTFEAALDHAKAVAASSTASEQDVLDAWVSLMNEIHKLGFVVGDKTTLEQLISIADQYAVAIDRYTPETADAFLPVLQMAKTVLSDGNAMQDDVSKAESDLLAAMMSLRFRADKSVLESVLADAAGIDTAAYTAASIEAFQTAYNKAMTINDNANATQAEVDEAIGSLKNAIDGLVKVEPDASGTAVRGDAVLTTGTGSAKTGETVPFAAAAMVLLAGAAAVLLKKKK
ncbi:hypothetical protein CLOSTMETH_01612 [[Clostridium] methylpentosum DSM 5476]|uniref:Glycosyl hydrolase family 2, sugar binding domain protein n=1 Tax=[Clostridium] methylpentosum DSM 5476 TaxID=537013 RepID=C0ECP1_9FIRM|nr:hypothetical protein CLOSTMETH_01612 [[Clostridium] methylpentosum DSM 5476]MDY3990153.1 glycosyl hydrolase [Massilioclostridium sp.]MEE1492795.1 glycosyl hydrolase [Massilioclostridium sp.]